MTAPGLIPDLDMRDAACARLAVLKPDRTDPHVIPMVVHKASVTRVGVNGIEGDPDRRPVVTVRFRLGDGRGRYAGIDLTLDPETVSALIARLGLAAARARGEGL